MATPRYPNGNSSYRRRGITLMEAALALSVIAGLGFVSLRIKTMGLPAGWTQTTESSTIAVKADTPTPVADGAETKTP